uniref:LIM zinc-binding domain-containing protein n=1 Tax=Acrobeloides nanus TaxID=290746 RepID=A0A914DRP2_9BILA
MPSRENDQFVDAVKPALESLLSDLQRTTEVLKRANERNVKEQSSYREHYREEHRYGTDGDIDPVYQEQNVPPRSYQSNSAPPRKEYQRETVRQVQETKSSTKDPSQLDSMLGNLKVDMDKHGVHTIPKGDCASCGKAIIGQVVIALGKMWHPEHYVCCHCGDEIGHKNFFERAGKAYCENDYHDLFSPRCAYCNGPIKDRCVTALGKTFHAEHFVCAECGREFGDQGFHERDGLAYCKPDFFKMFAPKCHGCNKPIQTKFITALGTHWHPECFICQADDHFSKQCPLNVTYFEEEEDYY